MNQEEQLQRLRSLEVANHFPYKLKESSQFPLKSRKIDIFQINVGFLCNLKCKHCHVEAGPEREELMARPVFGKCLEILENSDIGTVDLTGGAPEMNPHLEWFIKEVSKLKRRLIVRTNFVVLVVPKYRHFVDVFAENQVEVVGSVPHFTAGQTNVQRGDLVFERTIKAIKALNEMGYGQEGSPLLLNLVHNPVGAFLPGSQEDLEYEFKHRLMQDHGVTFNQLFTITNMPIGRYLEYLDRSDNFDEYMETLVDAYNPNAVHNVMCRDTLSVRWDGKLFDCDFNQMLNLPVDHGAPNHIMNFDLKQLDTRRIVTANHCFGCTAGAGSSCQGATT
ncbi:MAG: radical SAM/Cys-rich domain protein [bacterium]|nr:radical SAM/Cys-rich domain protein [bacterium]